MHEKCSNVPADPRTRRMSNAQNVTLQELLCLHGDTKHVSIGKIIDLDSAYCSVKLPFRPIYEVSRQSVISYTAKDLLVGSYILAKMAENNDKISTIVNLKSWGSIPHCYVGFVEEYVGKNMVTVAFIDDQDNISTAIVSKKSAIFFSDDNAAKDSFLVGTRVAICVEKNSSNEPNKKGNATEYKGLLVFKFSIVQPGPEYFQILIHGKQLSEEKLSKLKQFFPSDVTFRPNVIHNSSQNKVLLVTAKSHDILAGCNTIIKTESHLIKDVPLELKQNVDMRNQIFERLVANHPGICIRLSTNEGQMLIACPKASVSSIEMSFSEELRKCIDAQSSTQTGYSSDSVEYEPADDDIEILTRKSGTYSELTNLHAGALNTTTIQSTSPHLSTSETTFSMHNNDVINVIPGYQETIPINIVTDNVAKLVSAKIEERKRRMEHEENNMKSLRRRDASALADQTKKPAFTSFEEYFGRFKSRPKQLPNNNEIEKSKEMSQNLENQSHSEKCIKQSTSSNSDGLIRDNYKSNENVSCFLKAIREEGNMAEMNSSHGLMRRPPSPPPLNLEDQAHSTREDYGEVNESDKGGYFAISNEEVDENKKQNTGTRCDHFPYPNKSHDIKGVPS